MNRLLIIAAIILVAGCKHEAFMKPAPVIVINTPVNNQHFGVGDTINIAGTVTHTVALLSVAVHMTDLATKAEFFHNHFSTGNNTTYDFHSQYEIPDNFKTSFKVEVEATDIDGNAITKEITISIN